MEDRQHISSSTENEGDQKGAILKTLKLTQQQCFMSKRTDEPFPRPIFLLVLRSFYKQILKPSFH